MEFVRARQPEQKHQRLAAILCAAGRLFEDKAFDHVSMREIAAEAGLGKASLYHYFDTKEEVFFELFIRDLHDWVDDLKTKSSRLRKPSVERVAGLIARLMVERPRCSRLMAILSGVLEHNIGVDKLREFKTRLLHPMDEIANQIHRLLPDKPKESLYQFLIEFHAVVAGLWPLAHPNEDMHEALEAPQLELFRIDFESQCKTLITKLLRSS